MARRILVTGGTVFVSKYIARYFADLGEQVVVLNRNTKEQLEGVAVIEADRHALGNVLSGQHFDAVIDVTAYNAQDVDDLARALESGTFDTYVMISSSAVYPTTNLQPFVENGRLGLNSKHEVWGQYSEGKVAAERAVLEQIANAYIIRPPYLYGPMNNIYRGAQCAPAQFLPVLRLSVRARCARPARTHARDDAARRGPARIVRVVQRAPQRSGAQAVHEVHR